MVCKKSLYCLKNGPCANYQVRKQIWEENIRFRESLRNINQSDHYWSFQITNNEYSDLDEPSFYKKKNRGYKYRNCYDCASVTHECTHDSCDALKICYCNKKNGNFNKCIKTNEIKEDSPETKALLARPSKQVQTQSTTTNQRLNSYSVYSKPNKNVTEYCHKYRNSLSSAQITPNTKMKFPSQSTLIQPKKNVSLRRFPSMEILIKDKGYSTTLQKNNVFNGSNDLAEKDKLSKPKELGSIRTKNDLVRNQAIKLPPWLSCTPISRTTRKMIRKDKNIPFTSFGCNNSNDFVGAKKTHNVYASTTEIYPNALSAKQQREEMIMKSLKNEKLFRHALLQDSGPRKVVNHSSLWAPEGNAEPIKGKYSTLQKKSKKIAY